MHRLIGPVQIPIARARVRGMRRVVPPLTLHRVQVIEDQLADQLFVGIGEAE